MFFSQQNLVQPKDIPHVRVSKPNVVTIGAAFYYALKLVTSEYLLFLENDFKMDTSLPIEDISVELATAASMLENGAQVFYFYSYFYYAELLKSYLRRI